MGVHGPQRGQELGVLSKWGRRSLNHCLHMLATWANRAKYRRNFKTKNSNVLVLVLEKVVKDWTEPNFGTPR